MSENQADMRSFSTGVYHEMTAYFADMNKLISGLTDTVDLFILRSRTLVCFKNYSEINH